MTDTATLITQLRILAQLTRTEAQVARLRVAQANGDDVRDELRRNAADADARTTRIAGTLRDLGALPDPVTPVLGRVATLVRGALEQAQPLDEALLGDLALEHQLRDRARYVGALADAAGLPSVRALADDLDDAHTGTVNWLHGVLAGVATGQQAALTATPLQRVAAQVTRAANAPGRPALDEAGAAVSHTVERVVDTVAQAGGEARAVAEEYAGRAARASGQAASAVVAAGQDAAAQAADRATQAAGAAVAAGQDALAVGRDATVQAAGTAARAAEQLTRRISGAGDPDPGTAQHAVTEPGLTRSEPAEVRPAAAEPAEPGTGPTAPSSDGPSAPEEDAPPAGDQTAEARPLPLPGFAELSTRSAIAAVRTLDDPDDVAAVLSFEQAHGNRPGVVAAARARARAVHSG
jgi:hypothetical protein